MLLQIKNMFKKYLLSILILPTILFFSPITLRAESAATNGVDELKTNLGNFGEGTGLGTKEDTDLKGKVANIINVILGFLGIIAVIMIIIGGYTWLMAGGNDQEVTDAKSRIKNAVIGLAIVLAAYIITNFVVRQISDATSNSGSSTTFQEDAEPSGRGSARDAGGPG